jgi:anti-sigma regulatory factor (Ser/Thr protein kinase)
MGRRTSLAIGVRTVGEAVVVSPSGTLELTTAPQLRTFLARRLADQPGAVIVMLQDLVLARAYSLSVFTNLARQVADWSGTPFLLVTGRNRSHELQRHSELVSRFIPVFPDLASALASIRNPPARQLSRLRLSPEPHSASTARRFVASVCELWHCEEASEDAVAITSELVANVVRHAHTEADLRLELRRQVLTVAVSDGSPDLPVRRPLGVRETGLGLGIVATLATSWGANPTSSGGKLVWATIRLRSPHARVAINNSWRNGL